ncbi:MAG: tetratricopeptide repeat protein [Betaproteobacteria bacterium]
MNYSARLGLLLILVVATFGCNTVFAGVNEGVAALLQQDYATALKEFRPLAARGDAEAQYRLGRMYEYGRGVAPDMPQAMIWLRKSAAQENASAQGELGAIYASGFGGVPQDDAQAVAWFQKAANQGNPTAQYNLGLMYAKGAGVKQDFAQAVAWYRKAADQGQVDAQFKVGLHYEKGIGIAKDDVLAYANYAIAARSADADSVAFRDAMAKKLAPAKLRQAQVLAADWQLGKPMPGGTAIAKEQSVATATPTVAAAATRPDKCSATGAMEGEKFAANNCVVSLFGDQHSVAIWFNEDAISPTEADSFRLSSYADGAKAGKQRTLVQIMFCPGGGAAIASPTAVKSIDINTNHARSPSAGLQRVVESPKDFRVEKMTGEIKPGAMLTGKIVGGLGKTSWTFDFDVKLPEKDAAAGMTCGK